MENVGTLRLSSRREIIIALVFCWLDAPGKLIGLRVM